ncbi:hypothetical protein HU200_052191 [Digitaria exilis]|uniref:Uncharacterized protein n=1 Tax=Digitaria exilis TaxID=1010633 RepID=A0A835AM52_9POAL|nr:hypothetical protein HU200_052191 [Digitaria exilis]
MLPRSFVLLAHFSSVGQNFSIMETKRGWRREQKFPRQRRCKCIHIRPLGMTRGWFFFTDDCP